MAAGGNSIGYRKDSSRNSWARSASAGQEDEFSDTPQRPPTVGQELPNNLYQSRPRSRRVPAKKLMSEKNSALVGQLRSGAERSRKESPEPRQVYAQMTSRHQKEVCGSRRSDRTRDNDAEDELDSEMERRYRNVQSNSREDSSRYAVADNEQAQRNCAEDNSRRGPSAASSPVDINAVMARLLEIQEYIRRVSSFIESMEKVRDKRAMESLPRLYVVRDDLVENEQHLLRLLEKLSACQGKYPALDRSERKFEPDTNGLHEDAAAQRQKRVSKEAANAVANGEADLADALAKRNELLQRVAMSHEKLQALQDQQAMLLALKEKAAKDALSARATVEDLRRKTAAIVVDFQREKTPPASVPQIGAIAASDSNSSVALQKDLDDLTIRLKTLHNICDGNKETKLPARTLDNTKHGFVEQFARDENLDDDHVDDENAQRRDRENETNELEHKKQQVGDLIRELQNRHLVELPRIGLSENSDLSSKDSAASSAQKTLADAQKDLQALDTANKLMKLTEMQQRLRALHEMVDNMEPAEESAIHAEAKEQSRNSNMPRARTAGVLNTRNAPVIVAGLNSTDNMPKADNLHRVHAQDKAFLQSAESVEIGKRFRNLQSTRNKLQRLQDALTMVQQSDPKERNGAMECAEQLLASLEEYPGDEDDNCSERGNFEPRIDRSLFRPDEIGDSRDMRLLQDHQLEADFVNFAWHAKSADGHPLPKSRACRSPRPTKDTLNRDHDIIGRPAVVATSQPRAWSARGDDLTVGGTRDRGDWNGGTRLAGVTGTSAATWGSSSQDLEERADSQDEDAGENEGEGDVAVGSRVRRGRIKTNDRYGIGLRESVAYSSEEPAEGAEEEEEREDEDLSENVRFARPRAPEVRRKCGVCGSCLEAECPIPERCRENNSARQRPVTEKRNKGMRIVGPFGDGYGWTTPSPPMTPVQSKTNSERVLPNNANVGKTPSSSVPSTELDGTGENRSLPAYDNPQCRSKIQQQMETTSQLCHSLMQDNALMNSLLQNQIPVAVGNCANVNVGVRPQAPDLLHLYSTQLLLSLVHCHQLAFLHQLFAQQSVGACTPASTAASDETLTQNQLAQRNERPTAVLGTGCPPPDLPDFCLGGDTNPVPWRAAAAASPQLQPHEPVISHHHHQQQQQQQQGQAHPYGRHVQVQPTAVAANVPETLNNQVPPGSRANNYWDNFRSYSRQNLLSATSCNKSNEFAVPPACPNNNQRGQPPVGSVTPPAYSVHHAPAFPPVHLPMPFTACNLTDGWALESQHLLMATTTTTSPTSGLTMSTADCFGGSRSADAVGGGSQQHENAPFGSGHPAADLHPLARDRAKDKSVNEHAGTRSMFPRADGAAGRVTDHRGSSGKLHAKPALLKQGKDAKRLRPTPETDPNREAIDAVLSTLVAQNESEPQQLLSVLRCLSLLDSRQLLNRAFMALRDVACSRDYTTTRSASNKIAHEKKQMDNAEEPDFPKNGSREEVFLRHLSWDDRADFESKGGEGCSSASALGLFQDDGNVARGTSREIPEQSQSRAIDVRRLDAQIDTVLQEITPMLRGRPTDLCTPKLLARISQRVIDCLAPQIEHHQSSLGEPHSRDSRFFYKQLAALLDEVVMKYTGRRMVECANSLLMELSEVFSKELAFMFVFPNADVQNGRSPRARSQRHSQEASVPEAASLLPLASIEITDADLVLMAKREELDDRDRGFISPSCDIPDVARRETLDIVEGVAACTPRMSGSDHLCGDECGKFLEAEAEGEEVGDNRDLAEADQSHDYLDDDEDHQGNVGLDDGEEGQGDKERTEDDLGERSEPAGAAAAINAAAANQASASLLRSEGEAGEADAIAMAAEMVLDEVPTKLRDPSHRSGSEGGEVSPEAKRSDSDGADGGGVAGGPGPGALTGSSTGQGLGNKMFSGE